MISISSDNSGDNNKGKKVFISHSSNDGEYVKAVIDLLETLKLGPDNIFCSYYPEYGIPNGKDIYEYLKSQLNNEMLIIYILSHNYYGNSNCLIEMGASWILNKDMEIFLVSDMTPDDIKAPFSYNMAINLKNENEAWRRLNNFKEKIEKIFGLQPLNISRWEDKRNNFIATVKKIHSDRAEQNLGVPEILKFENAINSMWIGRIIKENMLLNNIKITIENLFNIRLKENEDYTNTISQLKWFNINTVGEVEKFIETNSEYAIKVVKKFRDNTESFEYITIIFFFLFCSELLNKYNDGEIMRFLDNYQFGYNNKGRQKLVSRLIAIKKEIDYDKLVCTY